MGELIMANKKDDKEMRVLKIEIDKNNKYYHILDDMCLRAKNLYNTAMYYIKNHYVATKNIHDGKENHENAINIMNEIHEWVEEYNFNTHKNNLGIMKYVEDDYGIQSVDLNFGDSDYNKIIKEYQANLKDKGVKPKKGDKIKNLCYAKNKWYGEFIDSNILQQYLKSSDEYKSMNADCSNSIIKSLDGVWNGYFNGLTGWTKNPSIYTGMPKMPNYKPRGDIGRRTFSCRRCCTVEDIGSNTYYNLKLDKADFKGSGIELKVPLVGKLNPNIKDKDIIAEIRVVPSSDKNVQRYIIEVVYDIRKSNKTKSIITNNNTIAIDIGVNRLATVCNNIGIKPFAINGLPLKSMNKHWNKEKAKHKSIIKTTNDLEWCKKLDLITNHRNNYMRTYMHKASTLIANWCVENNISKVVIGKNKGWKQDANMGKEQNQTFVQIPFARFIEMLEYKCKERGMEVILQEESYTSKASFIDNERIGVYGKEDIVYKNRRKPRGKYTSDSGVIIHSDLNGAYNILRKYDDNFTYDNNFLHPHIIDVG